MGRNHSGYTASLCNLLSTKLHRNIQASPLRKGNVEDCCLKWTFSAISSNLCKCDNQALKKIHLATAALKQSYCSNK